MSGNGNQVPLAPTQRGPGSYPRVSTPHRPDCYHGSGGTGSYMGGGAAGAAQGSAQQPMRVQSAPQPPAQPQQQQEMSKNNMQQHNFVPTQSQTPQPRAPYSLHPYRTAQHGSRPANHPRQQQPFMQGGANSGNAPVMYTSTLLFPPGPMGMPQSYQQPRSQGFYQYMHAPLHYSYASNPPNQPSFYYPPSSTQLPAPALGATPAPRAPPAPSAQTTPPAALQHQPQQHIHQNVAGIRSAPARRTSHRLKIIHPITNVDILSEISNDSQVSGESSERQTPQPEPINNSIVEEFTRKVSEVAREPSENIKSNYSRKNIEIPVTSTSITSSQPQTNAIISINNNIVKSENILPVIENKTLGPDESVEPGETPVVSAMSDSPVIVPKLPTNIKQTQKNSEQSVQSLYIDNTSKSTPTSKKQNKSKPVVPKNEDIEKSTESVVPCSGSSPLPQRTPRLRTDQTNGPTSVASAEQVDHQEVVKSQTSQNGPVDVTPPMSESITAKQSSPTCEGEIIEEAKAELNEVEPAVILSPSADSSELTTPVTENQLPTIIEIAERDKQLIEKVEGDNIEASSVTEAQAKLTQSIASCIRHPEDKMKDLNLNNNLTDPDAANGNTAETTGNIESQEDLNTNDKVAKNAKNMNNQEDKGSNNDVSINELESLENGKKETEINASEEEKVDPDTNDDDANEESVPLESTETLPSAPAVFVPKYKYTDDQWSPLNKTGKKCYDLDLLKQIKDDPLSKNKPDISNPEAFKVIRETMSFSPISRPINDSLFPSFAKPGVTRNTSRDPKKDGRNISLGGRGSTKLSPHPSSSDSHKPVIHMSLRKEVKLNESENAWKPTRYKKENMQEEEFKTEQLYHKFRGILNKLTPQKFDTLMEKVKKLEINNQKRLQGVIDLVFEKAIEEPNFSEAYAAMCNKLYNWKVPADNPTSPDQFVNFRTLIISKCQNQFQNVKVDEQVLKLEKDLNEATDPAKKKELQLLLDEENRRVRMRSVGNVRFIGELYKLKMLTSRIMMFCMNHLLDKTEEEKLECLCKLLTTIGQQVESEVKDQLNEVFKRMQAIISDKKNNKISSRVRFMIQDVIELRRRNWVVKSVIDSQPKMMDQIQKEAAEQQRNIELMNSGPMGGFRREERGRGKRDSRQGNSNNLSDNNWKPSTRGNPLDISKLKAGANKSSLGSIKLAPQGNWMQGSSNKNMSQTATSSPLFNLATTTNNKYSALAEPEPLLGNKDIPSSTYHAKRASIERSTFNPRPVSGGGVNRSGSMGVPPTPSPAVAPPEPPAPEPQQPLPDAKRKSVVSTIDLYLLNNNDNNELVADVKQLFPPQYHAAVVTEIVNHSLQKSAKDIDTIAMSLLHLVSTGTISSENLLAGLNEIFEIASDLYIDVPMLYDYLGKYVAPQIEKKHITFEQLLRLTKNINEHGHLFLRAVFKYMKDSMGPTFVKSKWQESGLQLKQFMDEDQVQKFIESNKLEFLESGGKPIEEETKKILTPAETQSKLLQLMNSDENHKCIKGWVQDNLGDAANEDWFMRSLVQAICEHALFGPSGRDVPHFKPERMNKYSSLINEFGVSKQAREANCLVSIQQLIHRLEYPQGLTLDIFQCLQDCLIISKEGFNAWANSSTELEGKAVMIMVLNSFYVSLNEADNEDSCSEE